jgi:hypothetical protein
MSTSPYQPSNEGQYKYPESFRDDQKFDRLALPDEPEIPFVEEQRFDQSWIWALLGIVTTGVIISLLITGQWGWMLLMAGIPLMVSMALLSSFRLHTRIDDSGVHFRTNPFFGKNKTITWSAIDQIYVRQYSPLLEYGGWGVRYGLNGWAYIARGNQGIQIVRKNGRRILLGTQKPEEVSQKLAQRTITV